MAQTLGAMNTTGAKVEVSALGVAWTDISGSSNKIEPPEQGREYGEVKTLDGDGFIITTGKRTPIDLKCTFLYTEVATEAFEVVRGCFESAGSKMFIRYAPAGGAVGQKQYESATAAGTSVAGVVTSFQYPGADAEEAGPTVLSFTVRIPALKVSAIAAP